MSCLLILLVAARRRKASLFTQIKGSHKNNQSEKKSEIFKCISLTYKNYIYITLLAVK